jgi:hypothetical protein
MSSKGDRRRHVYEPPITYTPAQLWVSICIIKGLREDAHHSLEYECQFYGAIPIILVMILRHTCDLSYTIYPKVG